MKNNCIFVTIVRLGKKTGETMKDTINVLDVKLDNKTAKESMQMAIRFLETDTVNTIQVIALSTLMQERENLQWREAVESMDLTLPGENEMLEAAGITDQRRLKEHMAQKFLQMFIKYLHKNRKRVFLLSDTEEDLLEISEYLEKYYRGIVIVGKGTVLQEPAAIEMIVNNINGAEADCLLAALPSPMQEEFIVQNSPLLHIKLWLGCGKAMKPKYRQKREHYAKMKQFVIKKVFKYQVGKQKKEI